MIQNSWRSNLKELIIKVESAIIEKATTIVVILGLNFIINFIN